MPSSCPHCRGELINDVTNGVWYVIFSTTTTVAASLDPTSFEIDVLLANNTWIHRDLAENAGVPGSNGRTAYSWTLTSPGEPVSGTLEVTHATLGVLAQTLSVSEQGAAAS